ncbi:hypothetical protein M885DRAFT_522403 [Pelagophyceae sp. CCMP2097]|nr:hypothetical protein M885DRAFT_522403 [Pelagophyceae sp. CCMP2097]
MRGRGVAGALAWQWCLTLAGCMDWRVSSKLRSPRRVHRGGATDAALHGASEEPAEIDEDLYSRQLLCFGRDAQVLIGASKVLVIGCGGVGVELAKDVVLAGVAQLTLCDDAALSAEDVGNTLYANAENVGNSRAEAAASRIQELNARCGVRVLRLEAVADVVRRIKEGDWDCVAYCDGVLDASALALDDACRTAGCAFVFARCVGADAFVVFDDFGECTRCVEREAQAEPRLVATMRALDDQQDYAGEIAVEVKLAGEEKHDLGQGDTFELLDYAGLVVCAGRVVGVNGQDSLIGALPLAAADGLRESAPLGLRGLPVVVDARCSSLRDVSERPSMAEYLDGSMRRGPKVSALLVKCEAAAGARAPSYMTAACGGVAAHEVLKACSRGGLGKPFETQLIMHDVAAEVGDDPDSAEVGDAPDDSRKALKDCHVLVVGAGATGCELLKNLAMLRVGAITACDDDSIEVSNLSRQFLFRAEDVGCNKAATACARAVQVAGGDSADGETTRVTAVERRLDADSTAQGGAFDARFFEGVDCVFSALDNVEARRFLDKLCVKYGVPMIDCGTLGSSGSVQACIPEQTESYGASADPADAATPLCTLKHHPYKPEHVVMWAKALFDDAFGERLLVLQQGLAASAAGAGGVRAWVRTELGAGRRADVLETLAKAAADVGDVPATHLHCARWAGALFAEAVQRPVDELLAKHPADSLDDEDVLFWSGARVLPRSVAAFDIDDADHVAFARTATLLRARCFRVSEDADDAAILAAAAAGFDDFVQTHSATWTLRASTTIEAEVSRFELGAARLLRRCALAGEAHIEPTDFRKDDTTAYHVDFIAAAANARGRSFAIQRVDVLRAKQIAGSVVPAIATTTAVVAALSALEFVKLHRAGASHRNTFVNLRSNMWSQSEPFEPETWSLPDGRVVSEWTRDTLDLQAGETFSDLVPRLEELCATDDVISIVRADDDALVFVAFDPRRLAGDAAMALLDDLPHPHPPFIDVVVVAGGDEASRPPVRIRFAA